MTQINRTTFRQKWNAYRHNPLSLFLFLAVCLAALITMTALLFVIVYILVNGIPHLTPELFAWTLAIILLSVTLEKCMLHLVNRLGRGLENAR